LENHQSIEWTLSIPKKAMEDGMMEKPLDQFIKKFHNEKSLLKIQMCDWIISDWSWTK